MRIEQLRETGETRPSVTTSNFDGVTRADALRELLVKHDFELARAREEDVAEPIDTRVSRTIVNLLLAAGMLWLMLVRGAALVHGQVRTVTIPRGTITTSTPPPTAAEAAAILKADHDDDRAVLARASRWDGPWLVVAPCWTCDVQRLRDARDDLARAPWWSTSGGRSFRRLDVDPRWTSRPLYRRFDRSVIGR